MSTSVYQNTINASDLKNVSDWLNYMGSIHVSAIDMGLERVLPIANQLPLLALMAKVRLHQPLPIFANKQD